MKYDHTVIYNEVKCNALEALKKLNLSRGTYYNLLKTGLSSQEAFLTCLNTSQRVSLNQMAKETKITKKAICRELHEGMSKEEIIEDQKEKK